MWAPAFAAVFLLTILLMGCGQGTTPMTDTPPPVGSPTPTETSPDRTATPTPREGPWTLAPIQLWLPESLSPYGQGEAADILAEQLAAFSEENPTLQVETTVKRAHGRGGLLDFMRTARDAAPSVLPDLVVLDASDLETMVGTGLLHPLEPYVTPSVASDRYSFAVEVGAVGEELVGFVIGADLELLAYRPALFESPPISWTDVITPPVDFVFPAAGVDGRVNDATLVQYLGAGGKFTQMGTATLSREPLLSVLEFYSDCVRTGSVSPSVVLDVGVTDRAWELLELEVADVGVVPASSFFPGGEERYRIGSPPSRYGRPIGMVSQAKVIALVADGSDRQEVAMKLLNWLIDPERNAEWSYAAGLVPGTREGLRDWPLTSADRAALHRVMEAAVPRPSSEELSTVGPLMQDAVEAVLSGELSPREATNRAVETTGE